MATLTTNFGKQIDYTEYPKGRRLTGNQGRPQARRAFTVAYDNHLDFIQEVMGYPVLKNPGNNPYLERVTPDFYPGPKILQASDGPGRPWLYASDFDCEFLGVDMEKGWDDRQSMGRSSEV